MGFRWVLVVVLVGGRIFLGFVRELCLLFLVLLLVFSGCIVGRLRGGLRLGGSVHGRFGIFPRLIPMRWLMMVVLVVVYFLSYRSLYFSHTPSRRKYTIRRHRVRILIAK